MGLNQKRRAIPTKGRLRSVGCEQGGGAGVAPALSVAALRLFRQRTRMLDARANEFLPAAVSGYFL